MKIAINLLPYRELGGIVVYAHNILKVLGELDNQNQYYLICSKKILPELIFNFKNFRYIKTSLNPFSGIQRVVFEQIFVPRILKKYQIDLLYNLSVSSSIFLPSKTIITIHDCTYKRFRKKKSFGALLYMKTMFYLLPKIAKKVITVSEFTKEELIRLYGVSPFKIKVIREAVPKMSSPSIPREDLQKKFNIKKPYFFWIGVSMPWKNIPRLIKAFKKFTEKNDDFSLILAGELSAQEKEQIQREKNIVFLGKVSEKEKIALFLNSFALIFPSLYEGFGLPVLEAQSLGVPVLTSNVASLPEVAGRGALFVDPYNIEDIARGMQRIATDKELREKLVQEGYKNIKRFSWERAAKELLEVFKEVYYEKNSPNK